MAVCADATEANSTGQQLNMTTFDRSFYSVAFASVSGRLARAGEGGQDRCTGGSRPAQPGGFGGAALTISRQVQGSSFCLSSSSRRLA